jgi:hypothetical protein
MKAIDNTMLKLWEDYERVSQANNRMWEHLHNMERIISKERGISKGEYAMLRRKLSGELA